jgi:sialidase-1
MRNALLIVSLLCANLHAAGAIERSAIFPAPPTGYVGVRVPALSVLKDGSILCMAGAGHGKGDWAPCDVLQKRSTDGGKTWSDPVVLFTNKTSTVNAMPIVSHDGTIHLLLMRDYGSVEHIVSTDGGKTYSTPEPITPTLDEWKKTNGYQWTVVAPGPGSGIELKSGRLLAPVWLTDAPDRKHRPSIVTTIYSDDTGKTWHVGDIIARDTPETTNPNESDVIQLPDGQVMINMRNGSAVHQRLIATSPDGATGWSKPAFVADLFEPICEASWTVVPLGESPEKHMLVHIAPAGDGTTPPASKSAPRENLTLYASLDDGKTWPIHKLLDAGRAAYSDVTVGTDGRILVAYESGADSDRPNGTTGISLLSIDPKWVLEK